MSPLPQTKVLHLFGTYLPNTENWAYNLISHTPNVQILIAAQRYNNHFRDDSFVFYEHAFAKLEDYYIQLNKKNPIQLIQKTYWHFFRYPKKLLEGIQEFAIEKEVDIFHAHFANIAWLYRQIPARLNKPLVISFYGWDYEQLPHIYPKFKQRFKILFAQADALICEGPHGAKILESYGCPKEKINIVQLGVQVDNIKFVHRSKKQNELKLIQLASFTQKKGHIYTIKAFHKALADCPSITLTLIGGDAGVKDEIKNYISTHQLNDKITIIDAIDYTLLHSFLADYQVFIQPSCYSNELDCEGGAPISLLDAQATGMPIIATTHCDIPMEVIDGQTGLLSAEKNINSLSENIKRFYKMEQDEYDSFAKAARRHVVDEFDIAKNPAKLQQIYTELKK